MGSDENYVIMIGLKSQVLQTSAKNVSLLESSFQGRFGAAREEKSLAIHSILGNLFRETVFLSSNGLKFINQNE